MIPNVYYIVFNSLYIISGTFLTIIISHLWINRKILRPGLGIVVLLFTWIWLSTQLFEYIFTDVGLKIIFTKLQYIGILFIPPAWISFCYQYTTRMKKKAILIMLFLSIISLISLILVFTNSLHSLLWKSITLHENRIKVVKEFTTLYYFILFYLYLLIFAGLIILVISMRKKPKYHRRQLLILLMASVFPLLTNIFEIHFNKILSSLEITPVAFSLSGLIVIYFARLRYFRTIPLAQHIVIESMSDLLLLLNTENQIIYINPSASTLFHAHETTIVGKPLSSFLAGLAKIVDQISIHGVGSEEIKMEETTYNVSVSPVYNWREKVTSRVVALRDITHLKLVEEDLMTLTDHLEARVEDRTKKLEDANKALQNEIIERKKIEKRLSDSLEDKTILLGEIHHRVKNNLQIIISLLKLQKKYIKDKTSLDIFNNSISRIQSIAIIHEKLYKSKDIANTNLSEYIRELSHYILASHSEGIEPIDLSLDVGSIFLDINRSIHCGLIINELLINSIKYAFPKSGKNQKKVKPGIRISFHSGKDTYVLMIKDNGIGIPYGFNLLQTDSLGMKIVNTLTGQLGGSLSVRNDNGTEITVRFPVYPEK